MKYSSKNILSRIKKWHQKREVFKGLRDTLQKNKTLFNSKKGGTCFILGNGPSLNNQNLVRLANKETFVMNNFWRHHQYKIIRPKYLIAGDLSVYAQNKLPDARGVNLPASSVAISQVPETKLFFNSVAKNFIEKNNLFLQNQIYYVLQQSPMDEKLLFNVDPSKPLPFPKNSAILALILAVYMGFETIYLLGCEHDYLAYPAKKSNTGFKHFYEQKQDLAAYKEDSYEDMMALCLRLFTNYRLLAEKISKLHPNVKIYNATPDSFLDVFPAVNFEDIE